MDTRAVVLAIDDDPAMLRLIRSCCEAWGYPAVTCQSGAEALEYLGTHPAPGLLLVDQVMPGMDGTEFARRVQAEPCWAGLPLAFMSGYEDPPLVPHVQFFPKPLNIGLLYALVTAYCRTPLVGVGVPEVAKITISD